jgi:hypothetical protein
MWDYFEVKKVKNGWTVESSDREFTASETHVFSTAPKVIKYLKQELTDSEEEHQQDPPF